MKQLISPNKGAALLFFIVGIPLLFMTSIAIATNDEITIISRIPTILASLIHITLGWFLIKEVRWAYLLGIITATVVPVWHVYTVFTDDYLQFNFGLLMLYTAILYIFIRFREKFNTSHNRV